MRLLSAVLRLNYSNQLYKSLLVHNLSQPNARYLASFCDGIYVMKPHAYAYGKSRANLDYTTVGELLERQAKSTPDREAVICLHENITKNFHQLNHDVDKLCSSLRHKLGLKRGDVAALWSANCYNWLVIQFACAKLGVILCTVNPVYKVAELEFALLKSESKVIFMPGHQSKQEKINSFASLMEKVNLGELENLKNIITLDGESVDKTEFEKKGINVHTIDSLFGEEIKNVDNGERINSDDPAIIMFTSGTTGKPKGALLSHFNLVNNSTLLGHRMRMVSARTCLPVPLFHIFGILYGNISMANLGQTIVLPDYKYSLKGVISAINDYKCTHIMMVPAMTVDILNHVETENIKLQTLKTVITGSAPTTVETAKKFLRNVPGVEQFYIRYGSTETSGCMALPQIDDPNSHMIDNVGAPIDLTEIKIVDRQGNLCKIGEQGELWARGHHVMLGYWKDEAKTKESIIDGWFLSGDIATMDEEGYVRLCGRSKELIIRGGENVYPKEIEELLHQHESIYEAFVCGVPDERVGEEICAWVQLKPNVDPKSITEQDIRTFLKERISYFKVPKHILFVNSFPRTPTGKAQKFVMTEQSVEKLGLKKK